MPGWIRSRALAVDTYYGWFVVAACFLAAAVLFGVNFSFGVFFEAIRDTYGGSRAGVSLLYSLQTFVLYAGAALVGGLVDRYGARRSLIAGTVLVSGGLAVSAAAEPLWLLALGFGVVTALGLGILHVVAYATVPRWFGRRRGFAAGVATSGLGVGLFVVEPTASWLVVTQGWRAAYLVLAAVFLGVLAVAAVFVADDPASLGVDASLEFGDAAPDRSAAAPVVSALGVVRSRAFVLVFVGWVLIYTTLFSLLSHLVPYASDAGIRVAGVYALSAIGAVSVASRLVLGRLADTAGSVRVFVACSLGMGTMMFLLPVARSPALLLAFAVLYAVGFGGNGALLSVLPADLFGVENINATFGLVLSAFAISGLVAPVLTGLAYDTLGTYTPAFVGAGVLGLVGAGLVAAAGRAADPSRHDDAEHAA